MHRELQFTSRDEINEMRYKSLLKLFDIEFGLPILQSGRWINMETTL